MNIKFIPLFISLSVLSGNALADAPEARHDWTGFYVGGFVGGAAGTKTNTTEPVTSGGILGFYPGDNYNYRTKASVMGGGTVGYNWQLGKSPYLIGLEGEYGYLGSKGSAIDTISPGSDGSHRTKIGGSYGYGLIGGRLGYAHDRSLFYVKSGAVFTNTKSGYTDACNTGSCGGGLLETSGKSDNVGYAIGGGIEQALPPEWFESAKHISIKAEYLYLGIGRTQTTSGVDGSWGTFTTTDHIRGMHTAKIGINYQFEGF
ncbi:MAG: outer membrane beta-barrel protein [Nitrosomonadaceae bacterium]|nr:outer membrane beta-barrel protein [Nitrosomonadaceae bacterium]